MTESEGAAGGGTRRLRGAKPPTAAYPEIARKYNLTERELFRAFHAVKQGAGLPSTADTLVDADGYVYIAKTLEVIGNLLDEV